MDGAGHVLRIGRQHVGAVHLHAEFEPVLHLVLVAEIDGHLLHLLTHDAALLVGVAHAQIEVALFVGAHDAGRRLADHGILEDGVLPVGIGLIIGIVERIAAHVRKLLVVELLELRPVGQRHAVPHVLHAHRLVDVHHRLPHLGAFGRDDDDAVGAAHAEDSQRRGVFQNLERFDVIRIEVVDVVGEHSVHHIERCEAVDRVRTADTDFGILSGPTRIGDLHTGHAALQRGQRVRRRTVGDRRGVDVDDRTRQIAFLGRTVTDHHGLLDHRRLAFERHRNRHGRYGHALRGHTDERNLQLLPLAGFQCETAVRARGRTRVRPRDHDAGAYDRLPVRIDDFSRYIDRTLREGARYGGREQQNDRYKRLEQEAADAATLWSILFHCNFRFMFLLWAPRLGREMRNGIRRSVARKSFYENKIKRFGKIAGKSGYTPTTPPSKKTLPLPLNYLSKNNEII